MLINVKVVFGGGFFAGERRLSNSEFDDQLSNISGAPIPESNQGYEDFQ